MSFKYRLYMIWNKKLNYRGVRTESSQNKDCTWHNGMASEFPKHSMFRANIIAHIMLKWLKKKWISELIDQKAHGMKIVQDLTKWNCKSAQSITPLIQTLNHLSSAWKNTEAIKRKSAQIKKSRNYSQDKMSKRKSLRVQHEKWNWFHNKAIHLTRRPRVFLVAIQASCHLDI